MSIKICDGKEDFCNEVITNMSLQYTIHSVSQFILLWPWHDLVQFDLDLTTTDFDFKKTNWTSKNHKWCRVGGTRRLHLENRPLFAKNNHFRPKISKSIHFRGAKRSIFGQNFWKNLHVFEVLSEPSIFLFQLNFATDYCCYVYKNTIGGRANPSS